MEKIEFYKDWYHKEFERKNEIENSLNFPFGIVSAMLAVWFYYLCNFNFEIINKNMYFFIVSMGITLVLITLSILFLLTSYHNLFNRYRYKYMPNASLVEKFHIDLTEWHKRNNSTETEANKEFNEYLLKTYVEICGYVSIQNKRKAGFLHRGKSFLYYSTLSFLFASVSFGYYSYNKKENIEKIYKIEITNPK